MPTRIKFCGLGLAEDARFAAGLGVDALGLVFYRQSPRQVSIEQARQILLATPPFVSIVALFLNPTEAEVREVLQMLAIDLLQFHGNESRIFCEAFNKPYLKAIAMQANTDLAAVADAYPSAQALLLDSHRPGQPGGTGKRFDWAAAREFTGKPIVLAGGLAPDNVAEAIQTLKPYAVDVSSGIESSRGVKSQALMQAFVEQVRLADADH